MRLVTFTRREARPQTDKSIGVLLDEGAAILELGPVATSCELLGWLDLDGARIGQAQDLLAKRPTAAIVARDTVRLGAPVPRPGKLVCIGLNYRDHAAESKMPLPERPVVFSKFTTSVVGPGDPIVIPPSSQKVDYEAELAVVIGRRIKHGTREEAARAILGYTIVNDVSARDFQFGDGQWQRGKSCDTFAPMGPWIATADEIADPQQLKIGLRVNGRTLQSSNTSQMIFGAVDLVAYVSETITLEPGDVIATGTPSGVGFARQPPIFLAAGDVVDVEIDGLGVLSNPVERG
jgi:2-keto-4-pentenoate hydratase/2-oxohepta-3-ene-1,7-dioic acid hydratase in catechol pathway